MTRVFTIKHKDIEKIRQLAGDALNELFKEYRGAPVLFLSAGGSAFEILDGVKKENLGPHLTIGMIDERYSKDPKVNNFLQFQESDFYHKACDNGAQFIDSTLRVGEKLEEMGHRLEGELRGWKARFAFGKVFATMGAGVDGHTAGIMPYPDSPEKFRQLFDPPDGGEERWVVGYDAGNRNQYPLRVTVTMPFLREIIDATIVYMTGMEKRGALDRILAYDGSLWETPARILREMQNVELFTDIV